MFKEWRQTVWRRGPHSSFLTHHCSAGTWPRIAGKVIANRNHWGDLHLFVCYNMYELSYLSKYVMMWDTWLVTSRIIISLGALLLFIISSPLTVHWRHSALPRFFFPVKLRETCGYVCTPTLPGKLSPSQRPLLHLFWKPLLSKPWTPAWCWDTSCSAHIAATMDFCSFIFYNIT